MTPPVPPGSQRESQSQPIPEGVAVSASDDAGELSSPSQGSEFIPSFRLALEPSYLIAGEAGSPFRVGLLSRYRPIANLGVGLRLDTNFTDEMVAMLRGEAIIPFSPEVSFTGGVELGMRNLFGQEQPDSQTGLRSRVDGNLFAMGIEAALDWQIHRNFALGIFSRLLYSPDAGVSAPAVAGNDPPQGRSLGGLEFSAGIRFSLDIPAASSSGEPEQEASREAAPPIEQADAAISELDAIAQTLAETPNPSPQTGTEPGSARTVPPVPETAEEAAAREEARELRRELRALRESGDALQVQIAAATRGFRDLQQGHETGSELHMRMDRIYDGLIVRPMRVDPAAIEAWLNDFERALREARNLRRLIQSSTERFGPSLLGNLGHLRREMERAQQRLPLNPRGDQPARAALYPFFPRLSSVTAVIEALRQRPVNTEPSNDQITLWQEGLANIQRHLDALEPRLEEEQREQMMSEFRRLQESFQTLTSELQEAELIMLISRASFGHYRSFQEARRPELATEALRAMLREFQPTAPEQQRAIEVFRRAQQRGIENLRIMLVAYIERLSANPQRAWRNAREAAIQVVQWIDPNYRAPEARRIRRTEPRPEAGPQPHPDPRSQPAEADE